MVNMLVIIGIVIVGFIAYLMFIKPSEATQKDISQATGGIENLGADIGQGETQILIEEGRQQIEGTRVLLDDAQTAIEKTLQGEPLSMNELLALDTQMNTVIATPSGEETELGGIAGGIKVNVSQPAPETVTTKMLGASVLTPEQDPKELISVPDFLKEKGLQVGDFVTTEGVGGRQIITIGGRTIPLFTSKGVTTKFQRSTLEGLLARQSASTT